IPAPARRRGLGGAVALLLRVLLPHLSQPSLHALSQPRFLSAPRARDARRPAPGDRLARRQAGRLLVLRARRGYSLRPLLGRARIPSGTALRMLLLSGHRTLHRAPHRALRRRRPGRTQALARAAA